MSMGLSIVLLLLLLLLLSSLASVQSFSSRRWLVRKQTLAKATQNVETNCRKLDEVYFGGFPSNFTVPKLNDLLQQRCVSGYSNISVLPYFTSDRELYGNVIFDTKELALSTVLELQGLIVNGKPVDVSLMSDVPYVRISIKNPNITLHQLFNSYNENVVRVRCFAKKDSFGAHAICKSPPHANRLLNQLRCNSNRQDVHITLYNFHKEEILLNNLDPTITKEELTAVLNELLGHKQFLSVLIPLNASGRAYVRFGSVDQANRASAILKQYKLMDKQVMVQELRHGMRLTNISIEASEQEIEKLCNQAVGHDDSVKHIQLGKETDKWGNSRKLLSCIVYFANSEMSDLCRTKLHGTIWKGNRLFCTTKNLYKTKIGVFISNIPLSWSESHFSEELKKVLGDIPVVRLYWKDENVRKVNEATRFTFVHFYVNDGNEAMERIKSLGLRASICR